ncbi:Bud site selection protein bud4 [Allomyces arbusculus]|nr:Bud site selection protein bud4 [Allomyces arbusculus]
MSSVGTAWFAALRAGDQAAVLDLLSAHPELLDMQSPEPTPFDPDLVAEATQLMGPDTTRMNAVQAALMSLDADSDDGDEAEHRERAARRRATILHLIEASTLVQLRARWGAQNTTLHLASFLGENDIIAALLAKGAPATPRNDLGLAPIDLTTDDATRAAFRAALPKSPQKRIVTMPLKSSAASSASGSPGISRRNSISVAPVPAPIAVDLSEVVARREETVPLSPSTPSEVVEKPLKFKGKYVAPADEIDAALPKINLRRSRVTDTAAGASVAKPTTSRRRVIGVDLAAFDEVLGDAKPTAASSSDEALARSTSNTVDRIDSGTVGSAENLARAKDAGANEKAAVVGKTGSKISETLAALASSSVPVVKGDLAAQADELFIPLQKRKARFPTIANGEPAASASPVVVAHVRPASPRSWGENTVNGMTKGVGLVPFKSPSAAPSPTKAAAAAPPGIAETKPVVVATPAPTAATPALASASAAVTPWGPKVQPKGHSGASSITAAPADPASASSSTFKPTIGAEGSFSRNPQLYIDHIGVDFGQARATFMQRIKDNPNVPKVPTKMADLATLATPSAAAAQVRRPVIKREEAEESGGDGQQPKSRLADIKRQHTKADSGTWRSLTSRSVSSECVKNGPAPVVSAVQEAPVEEEEVSEQVMDVAPEVQEPESEPVEEVVDPEPPAPAEVQDEEEQLPEADPVPETEDRTTDVLAADADDSQAASSSTNLLPPLPTLDFDFSLDDLAPSLMYMLDRPRSPSPPPPTIRDDPPTTTKQLGSTLETFPTLAHSTTTDATSDQVSDLSQTLRTEDARSTMTADDDVDLIEDHAAIEVTTHFGGAPIPKIARRATISVAATQPAPVPSATAAPQLPPRRESMSASMEVPVTTAARRASFSVGSVPAPGLRAASPLGSSPLKPKKSVSFRPTIPGSIAGPSSVGIVEDGTLMMKVGKVSGLEWVLSGRQMTHVFVTVTKRDAAVFASKPFLVMSDSVGMGDEAPIHVTANDTLQVNVCLRYEQRQQAKTGFLASANRLFQAGKRADAAGDTVRDIREEIVATAPIPVASVLPRARGVLQAMTLVSTTGRPVTVDVGALFLPSITPATMPFRTMRDAVDQIVRLRVLRNEIQCEGTLAQHGGDTRHWKRRYFRLVGWKLVPFSDAMVPRDALDLAQCTGMAKGADLVARDPGHHLASLPRSFVLQFKNGESVCFACDSDESFAQWTDGIEGMLAMWPGEAMMQLIANCSM